MLTLRMKVACQARQDTTLAAELLCQSIQPAGTALQTSVITDQ